VANNKDAVIIGGGIIGCSIALGLAQRGLSVALYERGGIGEEASWAAAGMLSPQTDAAARNAFFDLGIASRSLYRAFAANIAELSGIDPEYQDDGTICLTLREDELVHTSEWVAWQQEQAPPIEFLSGDAARAMEPSISPNTKGAAFIKADHQIENRRLMDGLAVAIRLAGIDVHEGSAVDGISVVNGRAVGVISGGLTIDCGVVVMAAGCWSGALLRDAGISVPIVPARGQMLALKGPRPPFSRVIHGGKCYLVPRRDNRIVVGSTIEYAGFKKGITAQGIELLLSAAIELVPALKEFEIIETWSGLRPDTADHLPILGPSGVDDLYLATGHFRNGILLAPITAELLVQSIVENKTSEQLAPFSSARFSELRN